MSPPARKSVATKELLRQVATRSTGRMTVETVDGHLEMYLMNGALVGAVSPDDDRAYLRRVRMAAALPDDELAFLERQVAQRASIFGPLIDSVPTDIIEPALADRFRENVIAWVTQQEEPRFQELPGVFVDNMQMGHNTAQLLDACCKLAELGRTYSTDVEVQRGGGPANDALESAILQACPAIPVTIEDLIERTPGEPLTVRGAIAHMLDTGLLLEAGVELQELHTDEVESLRPMPHQAEDDEDDEDDLPTVQSHNALLDFDEEDTGEPVEPVKPTGGLASFLHTAQLDDEDMALFEEVDDDHRGDGQGSFSTEIHNLDKVDVGLGADNMEDVLPEVLEVEEAPATRFAAPVLSEDIAYQKIAVCNDVLSKVAAAFDEAEGAGRGQAVVQLLVDGSPSLFSAVLHSLSVTAKGELPAEQLLDNLAGRPPTEHRQLLNSALKDVIDRGLSSAADELPDEIFDDLYGSVAGYNQRLGL